MVSSIAITAKEGAELEEKPQLKRRNPPGRQQHGASPPAPRGLTDDLEERLGSRLFFSINELAALSGKSPATIFRLLRLGLLPFVQVGGSRAFTRAIVLDFLRHGTRKSEAA